MFDCLHGSNGLKLCHLNIASLYVKIDEIRDIFAYTDVHVFSFNETYLDSSISNDEINLQEFHRFSER